MKEIIIPDGVTTIGENAYSGCSGLLSVTVPRSLRFVKNGAFGGCSNLGKVLIEDISQWFNIDFASESSTPLGYAKHLYNNDREITEIKIPDDVISIGPYALYNNIGLSELYIPKSVTSIGYKALYGCSGLKSIKVENKRPIKTEMFATDDIYTNCVLYVPEGSESAYYVAEGWKEFKNIKTYKEKATVAQDTNGDGRVDTQDVIEIYYIMRNDLQDDIIENYDVNGDGRIDTQDVLDIYQYMQQH